MNAAIVSGWTNMGNLDGAAGFMLGWFGVAWGVVGGTDPEGAGPEADDVLAALFTGERFAIVGVEFALLALAGDGNIWGVLSEPDLPAVACASASSAARCCLSMSELRRLEIASRPSFLKVRTSVAGLSMHAYINLRQFT